jgi:hypothetical protein
MRSAGSRLPDGADGDGAGSSCTKGLELVVGSALTAAPFAAPQTITMASAVAAREFRKAGIGLARCPRILID